MQNLTTIQLIVVAILPIVFAVTIHEVAHGYVAYRFGDKTAQNFGRLTLNPIKHIDIIGTLLVPLVLFLTSNIIFGWAKPVPINSRYLANPRRDLAYIALAGPLANVLMAFAWGGIAKCVVNFPALLAIRFMGEFGIQLNVIFAIVNLVPLPPLDGGQIIECMLPGKIGIWYGRIAPYGIWIVLLLFMSGTLQTILRPLMSFLMQQIYALYGL